MAKLKISTHELANILDDLIEDEGMDTTRGICWSCGALKDGCEPDATNYECDECGEKNVQGSLNCAMRVT